MEEIRALHANITSGCNLKCEYCFVGDVKNYLLPHEHFIKFVNYFSDFAVPGVRISFSGGEPTSHPHLMEMIDHVIDIFTDPEIRIATNGIISGRKIEELTRRDVHLIITFEGLPGIHDKERKFPSGIGSSSFVIKTIRKIAEESPRLLTVRFNYSPLKFGREEEIADFLASLGVERVELGVLSPDGRGSLYRWVNVEESLRRIPLMYRALEEKGIEVGLKWAPLQVPWVSCGAGKHMFTLTADSKIVGCMNIVLASELPEDKKIFVFGEVSEGVTIFRERLERFVKFAYGIPEKCRKCPLRQYCGGCPYERINDGKYGRYSENYCSQKLLEIRGVEKIKGIKLL